MDSGKFLAPQINFDTYMYVVKWDIYIYTVLDGEKWHISGQGYILETSNYCQNMKAVKKFR